MQSFPWRAYIILDHPMDESFKVVSDAARRLNETAAICVEKRKQRMGLGYNMYHGIKRLGELFNPNPDDLVAIIDADDIIEPRAFNIVEKEYIRYPDTLVTHGSYVKKTKNRKTRVSKPYPHGCRFREYPWRGSHLKTFKWKLWKHMKPEYFQHEGVWAEGASDLALMFPLMELAGRDRIRHIHKPIYIWRDNYRGSTPSSAQKKWDKIIRAKKPLTRLVDNQLECGGNTIG